MHSNVTNIIIEFIEQNYSFFDESLKLEPESNIKNLESKQMEAFRRGFMIHLEMALDIRKKLVEDLEEENPVSCFIVAVRELRNVRERNKEDEKSLLRTFLNKNGSLDHSKKLNEIKKLKKLNSEYLDKSRNVTEFLKNNLSKIEPIIKLWNKENEKNKKNNNHIQKNAKPTNNQIMNIDNNSNYDDEVVVFEKCTIAEFIIENNFLILISLQWAIRDTPLFLIYKDQLESMMAKKGLTEEILLARRTDINKPVMVKSSPQVFRNRMVLEALGYYIKISALNRDMTKLAEFIELILNEDQEGLEEFFNRDIRNVKVNRYLARNLPTLIPLIEQHSNGESYPKVVDDEITESTAEIIVEYISQNISFVYSMMFYTIIPDYQKALSSSQVEFYKRLLAKHPELIERFEKNFKNLYNFAKKQKIDIDSILHSFCQAIIYLHNKDARGGREKLNTALCKGSIFTDFLVENLPELEDAFQYWNQIPRQIALELEQKVLVREQKKALELGQVVVAITQKISFIYAMIYFTTFEGQMKEMESSHKQRKLYEDMMDTHSDTVMEFDEKFLNFLAPEPDKNLAQALVPIIIDLKNGKAGSKEALEELLSKEPDLTSFLAENLPSLEGAIECWNDMQFAPENCAATKTSNQSVVKKTEEPHVVKETEESHVVKETEESHVVKETEESHVVKETEESHVVKETEESHVVKETEESHVVKETEESHVVKETEESHVVKETEESHVVKETEESHVVKETEESRVVKKLRNLV